MVIDNSYSLKKKEKENKYDFEVRALKCVNTLTKVIVLQNYFFFTEFQGR